MRIAIVYGLDAPPDGNGLEGIANYLRLLGHAVDIYDKPVIGMSNVKLNGSYDSLIGHSYGANACLDYIKANPLRVRQLFLIEPVKRLWYLNPFFYLGLLKFTVNPQGIYRCLSYYTRPSISSIVDGASNIKIDGVSHTSIIPVVAKKIQDAAWFIPLS